MNQNLSQEGSPSFLDRCIEHGLDNREVLQQMITRSALDIDTLEKMLTRNPVGRRAAEHILLVFSDHLGIPFSLDNTSVALLPTFADLHKQHTFDIGRLAMHAGVPSIIPDDMLADRPVPIHYARQVLQMASRMTSEHYTLDTVDVAIEEETDR